MYYKAHRCCYSGSSQGQCGAAQALSWIWRCVWPAGTLVLGPLRSPVLRGVQDSIRPACSEVFTLDGTKTRWLYVPPCLSLQHPGPYFADCWGCMRKTPKSIVLLSLSSKQSEKESQRANMEAKIASLLWRCEVGRYKTLSEPNKLAKVEPQN